MSQAVTWDNDYRRCAMSMKREVHFSTIVGAGVDANEVLGRARGHLLTLDPTPHR